MLLQILFTIFICGVICDDHSLDAVALICPEGWTPYGQAWYATPYQQISLYEQRKVFSSHDINYALKDQYYYNYNPSNYKVCLLCKNETNFSQTMIEMCTTKTKANKGKPKHWHYQNQKCNSDYNTNSANVIRWCEKETLRGIIVKLHYNNLLSSLNTISPIFQIKDNKNPAENTNQSVSKNLLLICPEGFKLKSIQTRYTMCNNEIRESFCILCELDEIQTSICLPQNCREIQPFLDFTKLVNNEKSCSIFNSTTEQQSSDLKNCLLNNATNDTNYCGYTFQVENQSKEYFTMSNLIKCPMEHTYNQQDQRYVYQNNLKQHKCQNDLKQLEYQNNLIQQEYQNDLKQQGSQKVTIIVLSILLTLVSISLIVSIWRPWTAKKESNKTFVIYSENPYYGDGEPNDTNQTPISDPDYSNDLNPYYGVD